MKNNNIKERIDLFLDRIREEVEGAAKAGKKVEFGFKKLNKTKPDKNGQVYHGESEIKIRITNPSPENASKMLGDTAAEFMSEN